MFSKKNRLPRVFIFLLVLCCSVFGQAEGEAYQIKDLRDNEQYRVVRINNLTWMAENLNYKVGNSWCYDNDNLNCEKYGRLYDWKAAKKACPSGWRLPSSQEYDSLVKRVGGSIFGKKLKSVAWGGSDDFGFSALPGGSRFSDGFLYIGSNGNWWTSTECGSGRASIRYMGPGYEDILEDCKDKSLFGFSVRCVQD